MVNLKERCLKLINKIMENKKYSLWVYVVGVFIVLGIINLIAHLLVFSTGFLIGMLAMYIAVHFYRYK